MNKLAKFILSWTVALLVAVPVNLRLMVLYGLRSFLLKYPCMAPETESMRQTMAQAHHNMFPEIASLILLCECIVFGALFWQLPGTLRDSDLRLQAYGIKTKVIGLICGKRS